MCRNMSLQSQAHKHYPKEHSISSYPWTIYIRWVTVCKIVCIQQIRYTNDWLQSQTPLKRPEVPSEMSKTDNEHQKWVSQVLPLTRGALGIWTGESETVTSCQRSINCAQRSMKQADFLWIQSLNSGKVKRRKEAKGTLDPVVPYSKNIVNSNTNYTVCSTILPPSCKGPQSKRESRPKIDFNEICHMPTTTAPISTGVKCKRQEKLPNSAAQVKHKGKLPTNDIPVTSISGSGG